MNKIIIILVAIASLGIGGGSVYTFSEHAHNMAMEALIKQHQQAIASFKCPPSTMVRLAPDFDVTKLNNKKGEFTYAPSSTFTNVTIVVDKSDTTLLQTAATAK